MFRKWSIASWLLLVVLLVPLVSCAGGASSGTGATDAPHEASESGAGGDTSGQESPSPEEPGEQDAGNGSDDLAPVEDEGEDNGSGPDSDAMLQAAAELSRLELDEKIGQLVMVGIDGTKMDETTRRLIRDDHIGGIILFRDNIDSMEQAVGLINELKRENADNPVPLWLSIDEEGGRVTRFPESYVKLPSSRDVGGKGDRELTETVGSLIGARVASLGLNMVYAPVLDVDSNPDNPVIGDRSFGTTPDRVAKHGIASMKGIQREGVVPVVKHFPGHGDTAVDSHIGLPVVKHSLERLHQIELVPFQQAIEQGADVVMVAHLLMESIDPDTPASYSKPVITGLLREELGFTGVVITDDLTMGAVAATADIGEAAVASIEAGSNIVMVGHDYAQEEAVIKALQQAVESGRISEQMLDDRVLATLALKQKYNLDHEEVPIPDINRLNSEAEAVRKAIK
ncbi:beta-N-acetylhexosaminidase [Paenibacillus sp. FSL M8-0334]|uniref:beta-N-acetylhexosaminidase n=1 Tax=Paenibacillus sp. FSL M8-0334 TaxID=2921623 RepID=UPI0030F6F301